jgi:hypothetical protein
MADVIKLGQSTFISRQLQESTLSPRASNNLPLGASASEVRYLYDEQYEQMDDERDCCPGCDYVECAYDLLPLRNETRKMFLDEMMKVAKGPIMRQARILNRKYNEWARQENERRQMLAAGAITTTGSSGSSSSSSSTAATPPDTSPIITDWPIWLIVRHVFKHSAKPQLRVIHDTHAIVRQLRTTPYESMNESDDTKANATRQASISLYENMPVYGFWDSLPNMNH